jgi:hypothetical protein
MVYLKDGELFVQIAEKKLTIYLNFKRKKENF